MLRKASGLFTRIGYKIAGWLRMDTQGILKRVAVVLAVVAGGDFPTVSRQSYIHSESDNKPDYLKKLRRKKGGA